MSEEKKQPDIVGYVKERLIYLHTLKQHRFQKYWKYRNEYAQDNINSITDDGFTNYHLNSGFALVNSKAAEIFANTPKYDFVGIDKKGRDNKRRMEKAWEWIWKKSNTNKAVGDIILDAMKYGSGFGIETYEDNERKVRHPTFGEDGNIKFGEKEEIKGGYTGCRLIPLEWHNVYIAGKDLDGVTEACVISHMHIDEFMQKYGELYSVDRSKITLGKQYYVGENTTGELISDTSRSLDINDNKNTVSVIEYWNKWKDEYAIIAGDFHINPYEGDIMPLIDPHKEIPIVCYIDHAVDSDAYGRGELEITEKTRDCMNDTRSLKVETVKIQGGIITIDPASDFDETVQRIGLKQFAHVEKDAMNFFQPNISTNSLDVLSKELNEDMIIETGVDHRGQIFGPNETAEHTKGRIEAQRKRINKNIRDNAFTFYERLARLRMENIKTYYGSIEVPVPGMDVDEEGNATPLGKGEWGIMKLSKEILSGEVMLLPVIDSIYGDTSKQQKADWLEFFQLAINLKDATGKPVFDPAILISSGIGIVDGVVDIPSLLGNNSVIDKELERQLQERGISNNPPPIEGMNGPSPYQQSGAPVILPSQASEQQ